MINIQRFTSRAKACSAWIWIYIYLFVLFIYSFFFFFLFVLFIIRPHAFSYQHAVELFLKPGLQANYWAADKIQTSKKKEG